MTKFLHSDVSVQISTTKELPLLPSLQNTCDKSENFKTRSKATESAGEATFNYE